MHKNDAYKSCIIHNKKLLNDYIALDGAVISDASEINSFEMLKKVADDIQARKELIWKII